MKRPMLLRACGALALVACGIDVVGIAPGSSAIVDTPDGSVVDARAGGKETGAADAGSDAPVVVDSDSGTPVDAGKDAGIVANPCAKCPAGTARAVCTSTGCVDGFRVFVTSTTSNGNLNGPAGGDTKCQNLAQAVGLGGSWRAWLSSSSSTPANRFTQSSPPYRLVDGTLLANDFEDLTDGNIAVDIHLDEKGRLVTAAVGAEAWTGTDVDGEYSGSSCDGFTTENSGNTGTVGVVDQTNGAWSAVYKKSCDSNLRLYCFEQ